MAYRGLAFVVVVLSGCWLEPEPEPDPPFCATSCEIDRDCGGAAICDKTNDGDDVVAADDLEGCCVAVFGCASDAECGSDEVCFVQVGRCDIRVCDPLAQTGCPDGLRCLVDEEGARCRQPPPLVSCELVPIRLAAFVGDPVEVALVARDAAGRVITTPQPSPLTATCSVAACVAPLTVVEPGSGLECASEPFVVSSTTAGRAAVLVTSPAGPVAGATVRFVVDGQGTVVDSDATGFASVAIDDGAILQAVTVQQGTTTYTVLEPPRHVVMMVAGGDNDDGRVLAATFEVDPTSISVRGDMTFGILGVPASPDLSDFTLAHLFGPRRDHTIDTIAGLPVHGRGRVGDLMMLGPEVLTAPTVVAPAGSRVPPLVWGLATRLPLSKTGPVLAAGGVDDDLAVLALGLGVAPTMGLSPNPAMSLVLPAAGDVDGNGVADDPAGALDLPTQVMTLRSFFGGDVAVDSPPAGVTQLVVVVADVPGVGLVPLGWLGEPLDGQGFYVQYVVPSLGLEGAAVRTMTITSASSATRPHVTSDAVGVVVDATAVAAPTGTLAAGVLGAESPDADGIHVRIEHRGGTWHLWSAGAITDVVLEPLLGSELDPLASGTVEALRFRDGGTDLLAGRVGASAVVALQRVALSP